MDTAALEDAVRAIGTVRGLDEQWRNSQVANDLYDKPWPDGILERATHIDLDGLVLHVAAREDLVRLKLAAASRPGNLAPRRTGEKHRTDLRDMAPTAAGLRATIEWIRSAWGSEMTAVVEAIVEDDHG